jgi:hypothetical protein
MRLPYDETAAASRRRRESCLSLKDDHFDVRSDVVTVPDRTRVLPSHALALRITPDVAGCGAGGQTVLLIANGKLTGWPR